MKALSLYFLMGASGSSPSLSVPCNVCWALSKAIQAQLPQWTASSVHGQLMEVWCYGNDRKIHMLSIGVFFLITKVKHILDRTF